MALNRLGTVVITIQETLPLSSPFEINYSVAWKPAERLDGSVRQQNASGVVSAPNGNVTLTQIWQAIKSDVEAQMQAQGHTTEEGSID